MNNDQDPIPQAPTTNINEAAPGVGNTALGGVQPDIPRGGWHDPIDADPEAEHNARLDSPVAQNPAKVVQQMAAAAPQDIPGWRE